MKSLHLFLDLLAHWWHRLTTSRYTLMLEARVRQLEADNAGMRDTIFGLRGLPPLPSISYQANPAAMNQPVIKPHVAAIAKPSMRDIQERNRQQQAEETKRARTELSVIQQQLEQAIAAEKGSHGEEAVSQ